MNKFFKGMSLVLASAVLLTAFAGCKSKPTGSGGQNSTSEPVELKVYLMGQENKQYRKVDEVLAKFEEKTKDKLNTKLNITWIPSGDYKQKMLMMTAAAEEMDLVFDAPFLQLEKMAKDGAYLDISEYFNNDKYLGLKKSFSPEFVNNNKIFGKSYGIPITNTFMDMEGVAYRKDLLDKYGMNPIASYDDLYQFLTKVSENEQDMVPYGPYGSSGFFRLFLEPSQRQLEGRVFTFLNYIDVAIAPDGKSVSGVAAYGDAEEDYKGFESKFGRNYLESYFANCVKFHKFLPKDILTGGGVAGKSAAASYTTLSGFSTVKSQEKAKNPSAEMEFWPIYKNSQEMTSGGQASDIRAWNFACIPSTSKKVDRTMKFLDWVFGSQENNDLFTYGIEGVHWSAVGNDQWKAKDGVDPATSYLFPAYELSWNPNYYRIPAGLSGTTQKYFEYMYKKDTFKKTMIAGFSFDQEPIKTEIAKCSPIITKYMSFLQCGMNENYEEDLKSMRQELKAAGVDKIKEELVKQINTFLTSKN